jgi:hypothetical protein
MIAVNQGHAYAGSLEIIVDLFAIVEEERITNKLLRMLTKFCRIYEEKKEN